MWYRITSQEVWREETQIYMIHWWPSKGCNFFLGKGGLWVTYFCCTLLWTLHDVREMHRGKNPPRQCVTACSFCSFACFHLNNELLHGQFIHMHAFLPTTLSYCMIELFTCTPSSQQCVTAWSVNMHLLTVISWITNSDFFFFVFIPATSTFKLTIGLNFSLKACYYSNLEKEMI